MFNDRIILNKSYFEHSSPVLEAAMLGHCPGTARPKALTPAMRQLMRQAGYDRAIDYLESDNREQPRFNELDKAMVEGLFHLPVPLSNSSEFTALFPQAENTPTLYKSKLAGQQAWLPQAVRDFFNTGATLLWIVRIPEQQWQGGFLPQIINSVQESSGLRGLACLFPVQSVGLVAMPDLERLQLPCHIDLPDRKAQLNPEPQFLPCNTINSQEQQQTQQDDPALCVKPWQLAQLLNPVLHYIEQYRPDLMCLYTPALESHNTTGQVQLSQKDIAALHDFHDQYPEASYLRRMQFIYPYLKGESFQLKSICGFISGMQCRNASIRGIWRSIAGLPINMDGTPFPQVPISELSRYRNDLGLSVLYDKGRFLTLDDEQLIVPSPVPDRHTKTTDRYRSAEVSRFMGYLLRELKKLGESLVFNADQQDPAPRILLERFFRQLYQKGALRGVNESEAFNISSPEKTTLSGSDKPTIEYQIYIKPAYPIDKIHLSFVQNNNFWQVSSHG